MQWTRGSHTYATQVVVRCGVVWSGNKSPGRCTHKGEVVSYFASRPEKREAASNDQYYDNSSLSRFILPHPLPSSPAPPLAPALPSPTFSFPTPTLCYSFSSLHREREKPDEHSALTLSRTGSATAAAMFQRRGRGLPVARGNRRYPDIDLRATRRVARLLSGRENVITALWWLR